MRTTSATGRAAVSVYLPTISGWSRRIARRGWPAPSHRYLRERTAALAVLRSSPSHNRGTVADSRHGPAWRRASRARLAWRGLGRAPVAGWWRYRRVRLPRGLLAPFGGIVPRR